LKAKSLFQLCVSNFTNTFSALVLLSSALLLYSIYFTVSSVNNDHIALAIPNQLQKNKNNNMANLTSSVKPVNHPPVANVGPDQTVNESSKVMLVGAAVDPDPTDKLSYSWTQIAGPAVKMNGADTATPTFTSPSNMPFDNTQLKFALTAKDDKGAASNNPVVVSVTVKATAVQVTINNNTISKTQSSQQ